MRVRDELGELFADAEFAEAYGRRGRPGLSPGMLALVTVLQKVENLSDRAAAERVKYGMDWKYALSLELDDPGFERAYDAWNAERYEPGETDQGSWEAYNPVREPRNRPGNWTR